MNFINREFIPSLVLQLLPLVLIFVCNYTLILCLINQLIIHFILWVV